MSVTCSVCRPSRLYGSPVPGYAAPPERTSAPGQRVIALFLIVVAGGVGAGDLDDGPVGAPLTGPLQADLAAAAPAQGLDLSPGVVARAVVVWSVLIGAVSTEVFSHFGPDGLAEQDRLFGYQMDAALALLRGRP